MNIIIFLLYYQQCCRVESQQEINLFLHKLYVQAHFWMETLCPMLSILETLWPKTFWAETFWADTTYYIRVKSNCSIYISMFKTNLIYIPDFVLKCIYSLLFITYFESLYFYTGMKRSWWEAIYITFIFTLTLSSFRMFHVVE